MALSAIKHKDKGVDLTVHVCRLPLIWHGIRRWVCAACGEVTTQHSCTSSMWQPCGAAWQLKSPCVLAHPSLSARSNHRQSSLCRVAVCAAGSAVLIETQEQMKNGADGWNQSMLPNSSIIKSQTCLFESKVNTMTATEVSDHIQGTFSSHGLCSAVSLSKFSRFGGCTIHNSGSVTEDRGEKGHGWRISLRSRSLFPWVLTVGIQASIVATNTCTTLLMVHSSSYRLRS